MCYFVFLENTAMKKYFFILVLSAMVYGCDDGDIIYTSFNFSDVDLQFCGDPGDYLFFKINDAANESLALQLGTTEELFLASDTLAVTLDGTTNVVHFRSFNGTVSADYFCDNIPPTTPDVATDFIGSDGEATLFITTVFDDNDGIPFDNSFDILGEGFGDFDEDGLPNFYDYDDDGDNVPTANEIGEDPDNPRDFDGDGFPDYLDEDDDNDGVLTRYEVSSDTDLNPLDNIFDPSVNPNPDYLNPDIHNEIIVDAFRSHSYNLKTDVRVIIENLVLVSESEQITREVLNMGTLVDIVNTDIAITPPFPD